MAVDERVAAGTLRGRGEGVRWERLGLPAVLVLLGIVFGAANRNFLTAGNLSNVARQYSPLALISIGQTFVIINGGIDLTVGALMALTSVCAALAMLAWGFAPGVLAGLALGTAVGAANGVLVARTPIPPFIVTLGALSMARGAAFTISGGQPISGLPTPLLWLGSGALGPVPVPAAVALAAFVIFHIVLTRTRFGLYTLAIGGNEEATRLSGVPTGWYKGMAYVLSGVLAATAGLILTARTFSGQPTIGESQELYAIASVVIGGTRLGGGEGSLVRTFLGVLVIAILGNGLNLLNVSSFIQMILIGLIIVLAVGTDFVRERIR
ncbi:MAG: ABC transporter permease [Bacillati bacterium ANGP1]|uniref:ABC transporter permease n=1 Tax=Candidatus Segetimicrobium genomatis TaxID=2569760 RepID=A0A537JI02_9BACT|nr:MAG: ABC transporter permease [Terrabacteria group bacterium ANGP1]